MFSIYIFFFLYINQICYQSVVNHNIMVEILNYRCLLPKDHNSTTQWHQPIKAVALKYALETQYWPWRSWPSQYLGTNSATVSFELQVLLQQLFSSLKLKFYIIPKYINLIFFLLPKGRKIIKNGGRLGGGGRDD